MHAAWKKQIAPYQERLAALKEHVAQITSRYEPQLETLQKSLNGELDALREEIELLRHAVKTQMETMTVALPVLPEPAVAPDGEEWLFDSRRTYLEQNRAYRLRKTNAVEK
jgi:hypothetical protein